LINLIKDINPTNYALPIMPAGEEIVKEITHNSKLPL
jgi:hypothetical protein